LVYRDPPYLKVKRQLASKAFFTSFVLLHIFPDMHRVRLSDFVAKLWRRSDVLAIHRRSIAGRDSLVYGPDVTAARKHGLPIVALESTIITHGMPYPDNFNTALKVEDAVRKQVCITSMFFFF